MGTKARKPDAMFGASIARKMKVEKMGFKRVILAK